MVDLLEQSKQLLNQANQLRGMADQIRHVSADDTETHFLIKPHRRGGFAAFPGRLSWTLLFSGMRALGMVTGATLYQVSRHASRIERNLEYREEREEQRREYHEAKRIASRLGKEEVTKIIEDIAAKNRRP